MLTANSYKHWCKLDNLNTCVPVNEAIGIGLNILFKRPTSPPISFYRLQLRGLLKLSVRNI